MSEKKALVDKNHGDPSPEYMKNGPKEERGCTDIFCCLLYILFFFGTIGVGFWAFSKGNPMKVIFFYNLLIIIAATIILCIYTIKKILLLYRIKFSTYIQTIIQVSTEAIFFFLKKLSYNIFFKII
jgi:hypothetical protein